VTVHHGERARSGERSTFRHAAALYGCDDGFLDAVLPFVEEGLSAGDPLVLALDAAQQTLLRSAIGRPRTVSFVPAAEHYRHPLDALRDSRLLFEDHLRRGATRVRLVGGPPHAQVGSWPGWARHEALCNHHLTDLPVSAICAYDTREASTKVVTDVHRLHSQLAGAGGVHVPSPDYLEPEVFLDGWWEAGTDPLEEGAPAVVLVDPTPADGRREVADVGAATGIGSDGLVGAVSEVLANALLHGRRPVTLRAWSGPGRAVVTVTDAGPGPSDPFVGLLAPDLESTSGRGLWIAHHLCDLVSVSKTPDGCVVRLAVMEPAASA
jgi:hypothetical protein